jgi:hypothetical protein
VSTEATLGVSKTSIDAWHLAASITSYCNEICTEVASLRGFCVIQTPEDAKEKKKTFEVGLKERGLLM